MERIEFEISYIAENVPWRPPEQYSGYVPAVQSNYPLPERHLSPISATRGSDWSRTRWRHLAGKERRISRAARGHEANVMLHYLPTHSGGAH